MDVVIIIFLFFCKKHMAPKIFTCKIKKNNNAMRINGDYKENLINDNYLIN